MTKTHALIGDRFRMNLKRIRTKQGLSQGVLSALMGINHDYLRQMEYGLKHPSMEMIEKTARALDVDVSELLREPRT